MTKYRVLKVGDKYYPQKKTFFGMFWRNIMGLSPDLNFERHIYYKTKEEAIAHIRVLLLNDGPKEVFEEVVWQYPESDEQIEGLIRCCKNPLPEGDKPEPPKSPPNVDRPGNGFPRSSIVLESYDPKRGY